MNFTPQGFRLDLVRTATDLRDFTYSVMAPDIAAAPLPPTATVPGFGAVPLPEQAQLQSCAANAGAYLRSLSLSPPISLSRLFLWYMARHAEGSLGLNTGVTLKDILDPLLHLGVPPESEEPYDPAQMDNPPSPQQITDAYPYRIRAYYRQNNAGDIRRAIAFKHGVMIGVAIYPSTAQGLSQGSLRPPQMGEQIEGGHALALGKYEPDPAAPGKVIFTGANWWGAYGSYFTVREDDLFNGSVLFDCFSISLGT